MIRSIFIRFLTLTTINEVDEQTLINNFLDIYYYNYYSEKLHSIILNIRMKIKVIINRSEHFLL